MTDYDSPWKEALESYFEAFMAFFFPQAHGEIDWTRGHEFLDKELGKIVRDAELGQRRVDKLIRVRQRDGEERLVLVHVEVQGRREKVFAERMYIYNYRLFDRYHRPVASLGVLTDAQPSWRPDKYGYELFGCQVGIRFPLVKLLDYQKDWQALGANANPFAVVVMAHLKALETAKDGQARLRWKLTLVKHLYERSYPREDILELFRFIDWVMQLPEELEVKFLEILTEYEEISRMRYVTSVERQGIEKGKRLGEQKGLREGLMSGIELGLELKFGVSGQTLVTEIREIDDVKILESVLSALKTVNSLEALRQVYRSRPSFPEH